MMQTYGFESPNREFSAQDLFLLNAVNGALPAEFPLHGKIPCGYERCQTKRGTLIFRTEASHFDAGHITPLFRDRIEAEFGVQLELFRDRRGDYLEFRVRQAKHSPDENAAMVLGTICETIRHAGHHPEGVYPSLNLVSPELFRERMAEPFESILKRDEPEIYSALMIRGTPQVGELRNEIHVLVPLARTSRNDSELTARLHEFEIGSQFCVVHGRRCVSLKARYSPDTRVSTVVGLIELLRVFTSPEPRPRH